MADKIIRNTKLDTFLSKLATKLTAIFWRKAETTQVSIDDTPTANSNNLVKSGGVKSYVDSAIPTVPVQDVTVGGSSVVSSGTAVIPAIPDEVVANPTVPSGTTPTDLQNLKVGNNYYGIPTPSSSLDDLSDVNLGTPSDGDVLTYDSTTQRWVADAPSGGELSTDVVTDRTDNTKASTPKSVYDFVKPVSQSTIPSGGLLPGVLYNLGVLDSAVTIDLATPVDSSVANEYAFTFTAGSTVPSITWPASIVGWAGNCIDSNGVPEISADMFYEVSILNGIGLIAEVEV